MHRKNTAWQRLQDKSFNFWSLWEKEFPIPVKANGIPFGLGLFILIEVFTWSTFIHPGLLTRYLIRILGSM